MWGVATGTNDKETSFSRLTQKVLTKSQSANREAATGTLPKKP